MTIFLKRKYCKQFQSSDMQFGYKDGHSTTLCTLIYKEIIDHYINNYSTVYNCFYASKAFDRVHYGKLFSILLTNNTTMTLNTKNCKTNRKPIQQTIYKHNQSQHTSQLGPFAYI